MGKSDSLTYRPQLDALRGLAVTAVLVHHLYPELFRVAPWLPTGWEGVRLFFVISGYLITGILLNGKASCREGLVTTGTFLRQFYARRFLRIFPAYYLTLSVAALLHFGSVRAEWPWHTLYLSNWLFASRGTWGNYVAPFWSLAVEEQYYLVWPLLLLLTPAKKTLLILTLFIICGPLSRALLLGTGCNAIAVQVATTSNLDSLGMGGLLAFVNRPGQRTALAGRFRCLSLALGLPFYLAVRLGGWSEVVFLDLAFAGVCVFLVHHAAVGVTGWPRLLLDFAPLRFLGKISYGVYLFHDFSVPAVALVCRRAHLSFPEAPLLRFLVTAGATLLAACISWVCFEKPLNRLKRRLPYVRSPRR